MKILMINVVCGIRSTGRICTDLADALIKQGHEVKIAYGRESVPEKYSKYAVRIGTDFDVKIHALKARLSDSCGFGSRKVTEKFIEWVKEYNPDVIHLHNIHGYYINIEVLFDYLRTSGKKIIWTLHDCWTFTGHTAYCDFYECNKWKDGCGNCPGRNAYPKSIKDASRTNWEIKKKLFTGIPNLTLVTPSKWLADMAKESFLSDYPIEVIPNGIDTSAFKSRESNFREKYKLQSNKILIGVSTAWDEMKGLSDYYRLADQLGEEYKVVLVGLKPEQMGSLPANVLGIERTNSVEELVDIYSSADCLVNLSKCESFSLVNLEAQTCGTPVITYDTGGCRETVRENCGVVVPKGDLEAVVKAVRENRISKPVIIRDRAGMDKQYTTEQYLKLFA